MMKKLLKNLDEIFLISRKMQKYLREQSMIGMLLREFLRGAVNANELWRTIEQSQVILLIVDIRNPLLHLPPSLLRSIIDDYQRKVVVVPAEVPFFL